MILIMHTFIQLGLPSDQAPADEHILTILVLFYLVSVHEILVRDR